MQDITSMLNRRQFIAGTSAAAAGTLATSSAASAETNGSEGDTSDNSANEGDSRKSRATVIAHRGFADTHPENTVSAFELAAQGQSRDTAARRGADWIEVDVLPTKDGKIAVFHDAELSDLTDTSGVIYESSSKTVFSAEVLETGETVPSLTEAMEAIPSHVGVNIDIKAGTENVQFGRVDDPTAEREEWDWLETVIDIATSYNNDLLFSTFWEGALATVRDIDSTLPTAYLLWDSIQEGLDVTDKYNTEALNPPMEMISETPFFDDQSYENINLIDEAHARDIPVNVWTVNTWYEAEQLIGAGADGLILDHPDVVRWGALADN